jgi:aspartate/methionine/tyrosine aminotransferase
MSDLFSLANRLQPLQRNIFADMDAAKSKARQAGKEIIDLSLGSSDLRVTAAVTDEIARSLGDPHTHGYLLFHGTRSFREAVAAWYKRRYKTTIDPETEVLPLIGSQEGTAHLPLAILNPGDVALLLDPGYPSHAGGVYLAGGEIYPMPLTAANDFLPVFADIPAATVDRARLMVLSYPHNPTTTIAPFAFFQEAVTFCQKHNIVLVHDFPYGDFCFDRNLSPSILQADPEKSVSIEFFTMSKSYNMGGFRVGFAIGNPQLIKALRQIKAIVDFNQYIGILNGAIVALKEGDESIRQTVDTFRQRRNAFITALTTIGWQVPTPAATMYTWAQLPPQWRSDSMKFCIELVEKTGVAASAGIGFGKMGEGYVRFALVHDPEVLQKAVDRISLWL